jgi:phage-related minor tail protein
MADDTFDGAGFDSGGEAAGRAAAQVGQLQATTAALAVSANGFASAMTRAFNQSVVGGKQFDDVLRSLGLRLSSLVVSAAFKPIASGITSSISDGLNTLFAGLSGNNVKAAAGGIKPFAAGGIIGTPTYFPLLNGGVGLAGEAGPEAIMPLTRGADGSLGVAASRAGAGPNVTIHIATPDAESFRRSETYITGQIARAVARGQRSL